ncbi:hypothetical protein GUITHDRAFT_148883 [Guillardia theta CCMP2712]|uniref:E3 ubiquitin-protein ligase CHFR n=2 Tax=Guillardia theta TaxID=55529 RepID=L1I740_GUITC|nr:hypothetical protein GUITHDRAFT_148883 [Guillardia theta CCMP2712]EKX32071.1 hypothetical protein GUITHDRAFT_148883 [Guillardia theta CCMP2712]|eukprot:XP_005819051.1 hypothetical protein GUITHDRAFT_148883 [Guillardia theta CCMP2712]
MSEQEESVIHIVFDDGKVFQIKKEKVSIGRISSNDIAIPGNRHVSKHHCVLSSRGPGGEDASEDPAPDEQSSSRRRKRPRMAEDGGRSEAGEGGAGGRVLWIEDTSTNGTIVNGRALKSERMKIDGDSVIELDPHNPSCTFRASLKQVPEVIEVEEEEDGEETQRVDYQDLGAALEPEGREEDSMRQSLTCVICTEILFFPVAFLPCMHKFCGACVWRNQEAAGEGSYCCPMCRQGVTSVIRDRQCGESVEAFLKKHPSLRRAREEEEECERMARQLIAKYARGSESLVLVDEYDAAPATEPLCYNCNHPAPGRHNHSVCSQCNELMPDRPEADENEQRPPLKCEGCDRPFCGAYFHWMQRPFGISQVHQNPARDCCWRTSCKQETANFNRLPPEERASPCLPSRLSHASMEQVFQWNTHERGILQEIMAHRGFEPTTFFRSSYNAILLSQLTGTLIENVWKLFQICRSQTSLVHKE